MPIGQSYAAWSPFQSIAPPWFNACARDNVPMRLLDEHLLVLHLQRRGDEFAAKQGEFFAEQRRDYIVSSRNGDTPGGLDRVGAAASA
jgi:hypothetical protein